MDHLPDQAFSMGSWSQIQMGALDFNGRTIVNTEDVGHQKSPKIVSQTSSTNYTVGDNMQLLLDDSTRLLYQQGFQGSLADASASQAPPIVAPPSVNSNGARILGSTQTVSGGQLPATWCQSFVGAALPLEYGAGQAKTKFSPQQEGGLMSVCGGHADSSQAQSTGTVAGGATRPRARARRGQATDPHSIAERLRRERIAVRMKSLQELVPNSNKADRASMLDEIIEYVKFLQLQVKVLSMSRLGGSSAITPLLSDLTTEGLLSPGIVPSPGATGSQDGLAVVERQVARLMEENMGSAMQFLQGKGLCLMPLSLAAAMSCRNSMSQTLHQVEIESSPGDCQQIDITGAIPSASRTTSMAFGSIATSPNSNDVMGAN